MFKTVLAALGIGAARIDLVLDQNSVMMGQNVTGKLLLQGGETPQEIEGLTVEFRVRSQFEHDDNPVYVNELIRKVPILEEKFSIQPGETKEYPFFFTCPEFLPVSSVRTHYFFQTNLEIDHAVDATDRDRIHVHPSGLLRNFLEGFRELGFVHHGEGYTGRRYGSRQMIQFRPTTWLAGKYDEITFSYQPGATEKRVEGLFELDKKTKGLSGYLADQLDLDEKKGRFLFTAEQLASVDTARDSIRHFVSEHSKGLVGLD
jgi:sporulation-control protein